MSGSACDEGRTRGSRNGSIWVSNGCRAEFVEARGGWGGGNGGGWGGNNGRPGETIRCESQSNRERSCPVGWRNARLVRQLSGSPCDEGRTWGVRNGAVCQQRLPRRVRRGPRLGRRRRWLGRRQQQLFDHRSSNNNRTQNCDWDERQGRPVLQQQLSGSASQEGRSWGYSRGQVGEQRLPARFGAR